MKSFIQSLIFLFLAHFAQADTIYFYPDRGIRGPVKPGFAPPVEDTVCVYAWCNVRPLGVRAKRMKWIRKYINKHLKNDLKSFLMSKQWNAIRESSLRNWREFDSINLAYLVDDITRSSYEIESSCKDFQNKPKDATAKMNDRNGSICFDAARILKAHETWYEPTMKTLLMSLALHEHLHHFGHWDSDNRYFIQFAALIQHWVETDLPEPNVLEVSSKFKSLRNIFRSGFLPNTPEPGDPRSWNCSLEVRESGLSKDLESELMPVVRQWFKSPWKIDPVGSTAVQWWIRSPVKSKNNGESNIAPPFYSVPNFFQVYEVNKEGAWIFAPFAFFSGELKSTSVFQMEYDRKHLIHLMARSESPGSDRIVIELIALSNDQPDFLPAVYYGKGSAIGYADCELK